VSTVWTGATAPVVVGLKDAASAPEVLRLAGREASLRVRPLYLVHAFAWPLFPAADRSGTPYDTMVGIARRMVRDAAARVRYVHPDLEVSAEVLDGDAGQILLRLARDAALVVVGSDRLGRVAPFPHDSVAIQLAARASCPVLVAHGVAQTDGPVVVGVDGSPDGRLALSLAIHAARLRDVGVVAVHASEPGERLLAGRSGRPADAGTAPTELVTLPSGGAGTLPVLHRTVTAAPVDGLVAESWAAQLVVVGARGWRCALLGPVAQAVLHHAHCPVTVARERRVGPGGTPAVRAPVRPRDRNGADGHRAGGTLGPT
jgi:nucleotide-binding universal stress UspA family protein